MVTAKLGTMRGAKTKNWKAFLYLKLYIPIARPAAVPMTVERKPTIRAIIVEVIIPRTTSPFGSRSTLYPSVEKWRGKISGYLQPTATDQTMMEKKGRNIHTEKRLRKKGRMAAFTFTPSPSESISCTQKPSHRSAMK